jgi:hypothetical protein
MIPAHPSRRQLLLTVGVVFACIVGYAVEITEYFGRYLDLTQLLIIGAGAGIPIGLLAAHRLGAGWQNAYDRMRLYLGLAVTGLFFGPLLLSWSNRWLDFRLPETIQARFISADGRIKSRFGTADRSPEPDSYATVVAIDGALFRFDTKQPLYPNASPDDPVPLRVHPGFWGLPYVAVEAE